MKTHKGFTLIELLVVIAIIGLLASVVLASLNTARQKGRDARRIADLKQIQLALELFYDASGSVYPAGISNLVSAYIAVEPKDPSSGSSYGYTLSNAAGTCTSSCDGSGYVLYSTLETQLPQGAFSGSWGGQTTCATSLLYCVHP